MNRPALQLRLGQQLRMTPQLQQAIRLLQLSIPDLRDELTQLLESNVMLEVLEEPDEPAEPAAEAVVAPEVDLEVDVGDDWPEPTATDGEPGRSSGSEDRLLDIEDPAGSSLVDHLTWQLELAGLEARQLALALAIAESVNEDGYLEETLASIGAPLGADEAEMEEALAVVQQLDPTGVGARSVAECITLQLAQLKAGTPGLALALRVAGGCLESVATLPVPQLARQLGCTAQQLDTALLLVRACHPRPGAALGRNRTEYVVPDVFVRRTARGWTVDLNGASLPRLGINQAYAGALGRGEEHSQLKAQVQEARWLLKSLEIRNETLLKVARAIVRRQSGFLDLGDEAMVPLVLREIAEEVDLHESTVSRVTAGKYMHTPRGVLEFRHFFSSSVAGDAGSVSSTAIRAKIRKLIGGEDPGQPLSDARLAELLSGDGVQVARRTVAKYREELGIPTSAERRRAAPR
ncbi:MAG: RNA polymerase factor sigma-54 [Steroidobacteraceae bacterium]